jgi:hypothetical protein
MRRRPIGQILVERNEISEADLAAALAEQERTGLRLGQILIETGRISWLALARAIAEQVLDIDDVDADGGQLPVAETRPATPATPTAEPSRLPPIPELPSPEPPPQSAHFVPRRTAQHSFGEVPQPELPPEPGPLQPAPAPVPVAAVPDLPAPAPAPTYEPNLAALLEDPAQRLQSVELLLKERQRAFIELVTTTETLRMKVARLEEIIEERDRELAKLRVARAV